MLISEFAAEAGLSAETVRFYVRKGLLVPETGRKGGSNPYQIFTDDHVETARMIRMGQSLGFSLREIGLIAEELRAGAFTPGRAQEVLLSQLAKLDAKQRQLSGMIAYIRAKLDWLDKGGDGPEPRFGAFAGDTATMSRPVNGGAHRTG